MYKQEPIDQIVAVPYSVEACDVVNVESMVENLLCSSVDEEKTRRRRRRRKNISMPIDASFLLVAM